MTDLRYKFFSPSIAFLIFFFCLVGSQSAKSGPAPSVQIKNWKEIYLVVSIKKGDSVKTVAKQYTEKEPSKFKSGNKLQIPYEALKDEYKLRCIKTLYPEDKFQSGAWHHKVQKETLWRIAEWFTGNGKNWAEIMKYNGLKSEGLSAGQIIKIPASLLLSVFVPVGWSETPLTASPTVEYAKTADLAYGADAEGEYAVYRLKQGEALYSAVVVRFTGLLSANEVNQVALDIARRSGIKDVTSIPIGYPVKISFELLLPEYLPPGHPRRTAYEEARQSAAQYRSKVVARDLEGVYVILDPGHGGLDIGANHHGVWESDYVYDIMCRVKRRLLETTRAQPIPTIRDREYGFSPIDKERLPMNHAEELLTTPVFRYTDKQYREMHVNLRWYFSNSKFFELTRKGVPEEKILFISIHADARHPSLTGAMIYVPGAQYLPSKVGGHGAPYTKYKEVKNHPVRTVRYGDKVKSQGYSYEFSEALVRSLKKHNIGLHPYKPVRDSIVRTRGTPWVPSVLRNNLVPTKILFEAANLSNAQDARRMKDPKFREQIAAAIVDAIKEHFKS